jgi:hypothetical protein
MWVRNALSSAVVGGGGLGGSAGSVGVDGVVGSRSLTSATLAQFGSPRNQSLGEVAADAQARSYCRLNR